MKTKHLFFDLDRTLWDFEKNSLAALQILFDQLELNKNITSFTQFHAVYKERNASLWKAYGAGKIEKTHLRDERFRSTLHSFNIDNEFLVKRLSDGYVDLSPTLTHLFPKAIETLQELRQSKYNLHIITNGSKEVQYTK